VQFSRADAECAHEVAKRAAVYHWNDWGARFRKACLVIKFLQRTEGQGRREAQGNLYHTALLQRD
jgi:hypothetical protein